jgi:hypothetical protein
MDVLNSLLGLELDNKDINFWQMSLRAVIVFILAIRLSDYKTKLMFPFEITLSFNFHIKSIQHFADCSPFFTDC